MFLNKMLVRMKLNLWKPQFQLMLDWNEILVPSCLLWRQDPSGETVHLWWGGECSSLLWKRSGKSCWGAAGRTKITSERDCTSLELLSGSMSTRKMEVSWRTVLHGVWAQTWGASGSESSSRLHEMLTFSFNLFLNRKKHYFMLTV